MNKVVADFIDDNNELLSIEEKFSILRNPESVSDVINKYTGAERNQLVSSLVNNANSNKFFNLPETAQLLYELKTPNVMLDMAAYNEIYRSLPKDLRPAPGNPIGAVRMQEFLNANTQLETALRDLNELQDTYNQLKAEITEATGKSASRQVLDETVTEASLSKGTRADEPSIQVGDRLTNEDEVAQAQARNVTQLTEQEASSPKVLRTLGQDLRVLDAATSRQVKLALQDMEMMLPPDEFELQKSAMFEDLALEGYDVTSDGVVINPNKFSIVSAEEIEDVTSGLDLRAAGFIDDPSELSALNLQAQMLDEISERLEEGYKELDRSITRAEDAEDLLRASAETYADNYNELTKQSPQSYEKDFTDLLVNEDERLFKHYDVIPPSPTYYSIWNDYLDEIFQAIRYDDPDSILDTAISWRNSHREMWEEAAQVYESAVEVYRDLKELHGEWVPDDFFPTLDEVC
jgi:predicted transcriptional regulator